VKKIKEYTKMKRNYGLTVIFIILFVTGCDNNRTVKYEYYENGAIYVEATYIQDTILDGPYKVYYKSGSIQQEGNYNLGNKHGKAISYFENGKLRKITNYKDGKAHGDHIEYYENGILESKSIFENGIANGDMVEYYENGKVKQEGFFKDGKQTGDYITYYIEGSVKSRGTFKNDEIIYFLTFDNQGDTLEEFRKITIEPQSKKFEIGVPFKVKIRIEGPLIKEKISAHVVLLGADSISRTIEGKQEFIYESKPIKKFERNRLSYSIFVGEKNYSNNLWINEDMSISEVIFEK